MFLLFQRAATTTAAQRNTAKKKTVQRISTAKSTTNMLWLSQLFSDRTAGNIDSSRC